MPDRGLTAVGAFGGATPYDRTWRGFSLAETADRALVSIAARRGRADALGAAVVSAFGLGLPGPGRWAQADGQSFYWTGPEQWLAESGDEAPAFMHALGLVAGEAAAIVDLSDAWVRLDLGGPHALEVLEKLCPLDLHPSAFPVGTVARTLMDHLSVMIAFLDEGPRFAMWVDRSAARSFLDAVIQAADSTCGLD